MDFYNRIKSFLGFPRSNTNRQDYTDNSISKPDSHRDFRESPQGRGPDEYERFGFNIFSNPLEMHRYFEHQMNEIIKNFGVFHSDGSFFGDHGDSPFGNHGESFFGRFEEPTFSYDPNQFPKMEDFHSNPNQPQIGEPDGNLRNQYLKPGYEHRKPNEPLKGDTDLDGRFDMGDLDTILKGKSVQPQPRVFSYGQSMSTKTIRNADGTMETHRTVTDNEGNQQVTVTHSRDGKEYSRTVKTNKDGRQEVVENFVNLDESEKDAFLTHHGVFGQLTEGEKPPNWFPFYKFFK